MAATLKETEAVPASYPPPPSGLSADAAALAPEMIWARIEAYIGVRWTSRAVTWIVEGPGEWVAPLAPATVTAVEVWAGQEWNLVAPSPSPFGGYMLEAEGPYRVTANVGGGAVPEAASAAYARLAGYMGDAGTPGMWKGRAGASSASAELDGIKQSFDRAPSWLARAMINSGAADLLRPYRRLA